MISNKNFTRLRGLCDAKMLKGPPRPFAEISMNRATRILTLITSITLKAPVRLRDADAALSTKSLKCYRIDPKKDIKDDKVYIGGAPSDTTLADELRKAADLSSSEPPDDGSVKPGDIEGVVGIVLGVTIGVILCATVAFLIWNGTFTKYLSVQKLYNNPLSAAKLSMKMPKLPTLSSMICKENMGAK